MIGLPPDRSAGRLAGRSVTRAAPGGVAAAAPPAGFAERAQPGWSADTRRGALALVAAGMLSALAMPPLCLVPVLWLTLPFLLARIDRSRSVWGAGLAGLAFGFGFYLAGLYWVTDAVLVRAAELWWAVPLAAPLLAIPLALFIAAACALARLAPPGWRRLLLLAACWTLSDLAREFAFTGFPWNPLGSAWEWSGTLGRAMIQPAAWVGVPGLTLLTLLAGLLPALGRRGRTWSLLLLAAWAAAGGARLLDPPRPIGTGPEILLVQGNISETHKFSSAWALQIFRTYLRLTHEGAERAPLPASGAAFVFAWPESAFPGLLDEDPEARRLIMQAAPRAAAGLVGSVRFGADQRPRNSLFVLRPGGSIADIYDKSHLVPFGEYQPKILPVQVVPGGGFEAGPGRRTLHLPGVAPFAPLICYEVIFPGEVASRADRPAWLLNITNDAWFGDSAGPRQHLAAARMRAVEEGLPLARAANTGISAAFDGTGRELGRIGWGRAASLAVQLPGALPPTVFARGGLWLPTLLALAVAGASALPRRRRPAPDFA